MRELLDQLSGPLAVITTGVVLVLVYAYAVILVTRVLRRHPSTFTVAILGFPNSGKTVYITTLFDELQQGKSMRLRLSPYGVDTVEEVGRNLNLLARGLWLPRTASGNVFFFRAIASLRPPFPTRIKLEIADFAGEDLGELQPSSERWLHKGNYFKYVMDVDAIMLAIDGQSLLLEHAETSEETINAFIACIQIISDARGAVGNRRLRVPVALLVMKADLFGDNQVTEIERRLERLNAVCHTRCRYFNVFFVSSTGPLVDGKPRSVRAPSQVVEPLEWLLGRATALSFVDAIQTALRSSRRQDFDRWETRR